MKSWIALALAWTTLPQDKAPSPGDPSVAQFHFAGQFKDAVKKSEELGRCLLVKGVAQIVDDVAVTNPKKGHC